MTEEQTAGQTPQAIDLMQFVPKVHFEQIPIRNLVSNQEYQRNLSQHHVQRAAANFDLYQINPVKVSRRNGINYVFNGQHTIEIIASESGSRDTPVWCMISNTRKKRISSLTSKSTSRHFRRMKPLRRTLRQMTPSRR